MQLCRGYNKNIIYKVLWYHSKTEYDKYIFVGNRTPTIKNILSTIAEYGYENIGSSNDKKLNAEFGNYKIIFGNIPLKRTYFVYFFIDSNDCIKTLMEDICVLIPQVNQSVDKYKFLPTSLYIWCRYNKITNTYYKRLLNELFAGRNTITKGELITFIQNLGIDDPEHDKLFRHAKYEYIDLYKNLDLYLSLSNAEVILNTELFHENKIYHTLANPFDNKESLEYITTNNTCITNNLNRYGVLKDNEIYITTATDNIDTKYKMLFSTEKDNKTAYANIQEIFRKRNEFIYNTANIQNIKETTKHYTDTCNFDELIIKINEHEYENRNLINLQNLFLIFKLNSLFPIISFHEYDEEPQHRIFKPYIQKETIENINIDFHYKDREKIIEEDLKKTAYIKIVFNKQIYKETDKIKDIIIFYLNSRGEFYMHVKYDTYKTTDNLTYLVNIANILIKEINKITYINGLNKIALADILNNSGNVRVLTFSMAMEFGNIDTDKPNYFNILTQNINKLNKYFTFTKRPINPEINLIYKMVDEFYGLDNINNILIDFYKTNSNISTHKITEFLYNLMDSYFFLNPAMADNYINKYNTNIKYNNNIKPIKITLNIVDNVIAASIKDIRNLNHVYKILYMLNIVIMASYDSGIIIPFETANVEANKIAKKKHDEIDELNIYYDMSLKDELINMDGLETGDLGDFGELGDWQDEMLNEIDREENNADRSDANEMKDFKRIGYKQKNMKYTTYMKNMRLSADPLLYTNDKDYNSKCPSNEMRQPYIITKEQLNSLNPRAITGYLKYRNKYYICPRLWDAIANKPISVEDFVKNGLRSPYTNGEAISEMKKNKQFITEETNVIIRKPTNAARLYWSDPAVEKDYPPILQRTGKDAFPGFIKKTSGNKKELCRPCCYSTPPADYKPNLAASGKLQEFKQVQGYRGCLEDEEQEESAQAGEMHCSNENYIKSDTAELELCRLGILPENLDIILNNNQNLFILTSKRQLRDYTNCFLRRGIPFSKYGNFFDCLCNIKEINISRFKQILVESIRIEQFITLNNGDLINIYCDNTYLPHLVSAVEVNNFRNFLVKNNKLYYLFSISKDIVDDMDNFITTNVNNKNKLKTIKKLALLYKIYTAYNKYIKGILNGNVFIDYTHYLDLLTRNENPLFQNGVNIYIFDKASNKMECNPYLYPNKNIIILIKENDNNFTPVFHIIVNNKIIKPYGVININNNINFSPKLIEYLLENKIPRNVIDIAKYRTKHLINIYNIHAYYCITAKQYITSQYQIADLMQNNILSVKGYVIVNSLHVQYLLLENKHLLPVYPVNVELSLLIYLLTEIKLADSVSEAWNYYVELNRKLKEYKLNYEPTTLLLNFRKKVNGIKFSNNLIVPVAEQEIPADMADIPTEFLNIYNVDFIDIEVKEQVQINQLLYQDYTYQHFKYELSNYINEEPAIRMKLLQLFNATQLYMPEMKRTIIDYIIYFMQPLISRTQTPAQKNKQIRRAKQEFYIANKDISLNKCYKSQKRKCIGNIFCNYNKYSMKCTINISHETLEMYAVMIVQDMLNSKKEMNNLIYNTYLPRFVLIDNFNDKGDDTMYFDTDKELLQRINDIKQLKYMNNIKFEEYDYKLNSADVKYIENINEAQFYESLDKITKLLSANSLDYILPSNIIISTPFDKDGKLNTKYKAAPCLFPYLDKTNFKLKYNCMANEKGMLICPTRLNYDRKPMEWGYCPEDPEITKKRYNIKQIFTSGDKEYNMYPGECNIPYILDDYNLIFECKNDKFDNGLEYSWCPVKLKKGDTRKDFVPVAATDKDHVYMDRWKYRDFFKNNTAKKDPNYLKPLRRGYCQRPANRILENTNGLEEITIDNYNPLFCNLVPSKGGYKRGQLYNFGISMNIPWSEMKKSDGETIIEKDALCKIINDKYREVKEINNKNIIYDCKYEKDIIKCNNGESKGGYKLSTLRELAINKCGMSEHEASNMSKEDLCKFFQNIVQNNKQQQKNEKVISNLPTKIDIDICINKSPNRGGYTLQTLKEWAIILEINPKLPKDELCRQINDKISGKKNEKPEEDTREKEQKSIVYDTVKLKELMSYTDIKFKSKKKLKEYQASLSSQSISKNKSRKKSVDT